MNQRMQVHVRALNFNHVGMLIEVTRPINLASGDMEAIRGELLKVRQISKAVPAGTEAIEGHETAIWVRLFDQVLKVRVSRDSTVSVENMPAADRR